MSLRRKIGLGSALLATLLSASPLAAQEPRPASLDVSSIDEGGVVMSFAWRFAPGDDPARSDPGFDDSSWTSLEPLEAPEGGTGWFRRHLRIEPDLIGRRFVVRVEGPGATEVFVDGRRLLSATGVGGVEAGAWGTARFESPATVLAVRRACSGCSLRFVLRLESPHADEHRLAQAVLDVFLTTVPLVLALMHLGLWATDRRSRENLYVALSLASLGAIVGLSAAGDLSETYPALSPLALLITPAVLSSVFFIQATFYEIRCEAWPGTWRAFAIGGVILAIATVVVSSTTFRHLAWSAYFAASLVEVTRLEARSRRRTEARARPLAIGMIVLGIAIVLQVLVVSGVIPDRFPWGRIYYVGLIGFAVGSSLFTVNSFTTTRRKLERNEGEIASARKLQEAMLPRELPSRAGLDIAAHLATATDVGGDYYDFREAPDGTLLLAVGDAAGHGLAAGAMVTAMKALFGSVNGDEPLPAILERCDAVLRRMDVRLLHMCLALVRFHRDEIEICSAAMPPPLVHREATGGVEELGAGGLPLGGALRGRWEVARAPFAAGDTLLVASDGVAELLDPRGTPMGFDAVGTMLADGARGSAREILDRLVAGAERWRGDAPQADDVTIVVVRRTE